MKFHELRRHDLHDRIYEAMRRKRMNSTLMRIRYVYERDKGESVLWANTVQDNMSDRSIFEIEHVIMMTNAIDRSSRRRS